MTLQGNRAAGTFDDGWYKWARAITHGKELDRETAAVIEKMRGRPDSEGIEVKYDAKRHGFPIVLTEEPAFPPICGLLFGDMVHDFRCTLDHVAWQLVTRGRTPPESLNVGQRRRILFPLCDHKTAYSPGDDHGWVKSYKQHLPGVRRADLAVVRAFQPYRHGKRAAWKHGLAILSELDNLDKHRNIQPVITWPMGGNIHVLNSHDCEIGEITGVKGVGRVLKVGTEVACIRARKTGADPQANVHLEINVDLVVFRNIMLWEWVEGIRDDIATILSQFSQPPGDIETLFGES